MRFVPENTIKQYYKKATSATIPAGNYRVSIQTQSYGESNLQPVRRSSNKSPYSWFTVDDSGNFEVSNDPPSTGINEVMVDFFIDGGFSYKHYNDRANEWTVGLKPGVALNLNKTVSIVAHAGFVGYKTIKATYDGAKSSNAWGVDLDGNNLSLGVLLNF